MPPRASLLMLLGRRLQLPECGSAGLNLYQQLLARGLDLHSQRCDLFYLPRMLLEPLAGSALQGRECLQFRDNLGHEQSVWRWLPAATQEPEEGWRVGYRISLVAG